LEEATTVDANEETLIDEDGPKPTVPPAFEKPFDALERVMGVAAFFIAAVSGTAEEEEDDEEEEEEGREATDKLVSAFLGTLDCCSDCCDCCCCCC